MTSVNHAIKKIGSKLVFFAVFDSTVNRGVASETQYYDTEPNAPGFSNTFLCGKMNTIQR